MPQRYKKIWTESLTLTSVTADKITLGFSDKLLSERIALVKMIFRNCS